ncbi:MAG: 1-acyl-sn-glycerol-3-phosphate acyltransferase [Clostridia bacterium]|nr:1-acyl-sn-glycerol-3-phosphate acyltransferase [Clostridia bacterium]
MNRFYRTMKRLFGKLFKFLFRVKIVNPEKEIEGVPFVVCCNHTSLFDVCVISLAMKNQIRYMAKKEIFKVPILAQFVKAMGAFPVDRKAGDVGAVKKSIEILEGGECLGVFPQGTRQPRVNPRDAKIKNGIGMFASRANVGILPVCIKTKKNKLRFFRKTEFIIGDYIPPQDIAFEGLSGKERYEKISEYAFSKVADLFEGADKK